MPEFQNHLKNDAGLMIDVTPMTDKFGRLGYSIKSADIIDDHLFTIWMLRWS
jgi:hypothetical protein